MVEGAALRVVFFGTPAFAVPTLDALLASRHTVAGVVSQPDRPRGRGHHTTDAPVKTRALAAGVTLLQPDRLADAVFLSELTGFDADVGVVAAYGRILTDAVLNTPPLGMINVHASLLPRYRGAAPVHRAIIAGEQETGITIMRVVKALDAGPMLATVRRPIGPDETSAEVERDLARLGAALLMSTLDRLSAGPVDEAPQDHARATSAPRLMKDDGRVDWSRSAGATHNLIRGLHPWPHAYTFLNAQRLILLRSTVMDGEPGAPPGSVIAARGDELRVACGLGSIGLIEVQLEGKRPMTAREFLAGHRVTSGQRFAQGA